MASTLTALALRLSVTFCILSSPVYANVDPSWLASWEEAVASLPSELKSSALMVNNDEPGTRLKIRGLVFDPNGNVAEGVIVHAYHRDSQGFDFGLNDKETTTWRIQGWAMTDQHGRFTFDTIKAENVKRLKVTVAKWNSKAAKTMQLVFTSIDEGHDES